MPQELQLTWYWQKRAASYMWNKTLSYARLRQYYHVLGKQKNISLDCKNKRDPKIDSDTIPNNDINLELRPATTEKLWKS